jgi:hypothetical protein
MLSRLLSAFVAFMISATAFAQAPNEVPPVALPFATPHSIESPFPAKPIQGDRSKPLIQYRMRCEVFEIDASGKEQVLSRPELITIGNFPAFTMIGAQSDEFSGPMLELLPKHEIGDHLKASFIPSEYGDGYIAFDIVLEASRITSVDTKKGKDGILRPVAKTTVRGARVLETVPEGEKFSVALDEPDTKGKRYRIDVVATRMDAAGKPAVKKKEKTP